MTSRIFLLLLLAAPAFAATVPGLVKEPGEEKSSSWVSGPLVKVLPDGAVAKLTPAEQFAQPIGHPAFEKISVKRREDVGPGEPRWIVSASLVSTNSGAHVADAGIYVGYDDGRWQFVAMSNLKGEVLFETRAWAGKSGKPTRPAYLYVAKFVSGLQRPMTGEIVRQYKFRGE
jgi:hypothetical protein